MNLIKRIWFRKKITWYADIPSSEIHISTNLFNLEKIHRAVNLLLDKNDEICIQIPTAKNHTIQISIWGKSTYQCSIERVLPEKLQSYIKTFPKTEIRNQLNNLQKIAFSPETLGFILVDWE